MATLPSWDAHYEDMQTNNGAVTVEQSGDEVLIKGDLESLVSFASSNPAQGEHKWIGLDIDTGLDSIVGATWNGSALEQADEDEASGLGLAKGHIVFWAKAEDLAQAASTIAIGAEDKVVNLSVAFVAA